MTDANSIAVCCSNEEHLAIATSFAKQLNLPFVESCQEPTSFQFFLCVASNDVAGYQLELHFPSQNLAPLLVDFQDRRLQYRRKFGGGRHQAIARALGLKRSATPRIVDATAGLGRDAFIMASLDCQVTMLERNPIIHALLEDGLRRLALDKTPGITRIAAQLSLEHTDSRQWLQFTTQQIDIVYLDPMYPHRSKSALVKKEMRVLRNLVGDDLDVAALLETALGVARQRVVVKRPKTAPAIGQLTPSHCIDEKKTRFDVYLTQLKQADLS